jgi:hypothetical protein
MPSLEKGADVSLLSSVAVIAVAEESPTPVPELQLDGEQGMGTLIAVVAFVLLTGLIIMGGRQLLEGRAKEGDRDPMADRTTIRAWLAVSLVGGLLIFSAASFWFDDTTLRSALIGGVVANAGAAVAFYFASKSSDQARKDILNAALPTVLVPNLDGMSLASVQAAIAKLPLTLVTVPPEPAADAKVKSQDPLAHTPTHAGATVTATLK